MGRIFVYENQSTSQNNTTYSKSQRKLFSTNKRASNSQQYSSISSTSLLTHVCVRVFITDRMRDGFNEELGRWDASGETAKEREGWNWSLSASQWGLTLDLLSAGCDQRLSTIKIHDELRYDKKKHKSCTSESSKDPPLMVVVHWSSISYSQYRATCLYVLSSLLYCVVVRLP